MIKFIKWFKSVILRQKVYKCNLPISEITNETLKILESEMTFNSEFFHSLDKRKTIVVRKPLRYG